MRTMRTTVAMTLAAALMGCAGSQNNTAAPAPGPTASGGECACEHGGHHEGMGGDQRAGLDGASWEARESDSFPAPLVSDWRPSFRRSVDSELAGDRGRSTHQWAHTRRTGS